jgi:anti-anti-sigma factor
MEVTTKRWDGILTFLCKGRLDGFGSGILESSIRDAVQDDDRSIVIDLGGVDYLSSAGIRVLLANSKMLKKRGGVLALTQVQKYPAQVLDMAGFSSVFSMYPTVEEAVLASRRSEERDDLLLDIMAETKETASLKYSIEPGSTTPAILEVVGDLEDVLHARLVNDKVQSMNFAHTDYALGLGAMGSSIDDALPLMGEMVVLHSSIVWLPTDGHDIPDFFTPLKDSDEVKIYTGYAITLHGNFHEYLTIEPKSPEGMTLAEIFREIFMLAKERKKPGSVIAVAMWGICAGLESSGIKKAPIAGSAPPGGGSILDPENFDEWMAYNSKPKYHGDTMVSFGIGVNLDAEPDSHLKETLNLLFYRHPQNQPSGDMFLHNHGVIFRNVLYEPSSGLDSQIEKIVSTGEFVDMRHLLDTTRLKKAKVGVAYISEIKRNPAPQDSDARDLFT